jgi:cytochrome P450
MSPIEAPLNSTRARRRRHDLPPQAPLPSAVQTLAFWRDPHAYLNWCRRRYGSTFTIDPIGKPPLVFMSRPADIKTIVSAPADVLHPGAGGSVIEPLVGTGSFMIAEEDEHLAGRRTILPALHRRVIDEHAGIVRQAAEREINSWPTAIPVALHDKLRSLTLRVILLTIFERETEPVRELHARLLAMFSITSSLVFQERQLSRLPRWREAWNTFLADRREVDQILTSLIKQEAHARAHDSGVLAMLLDTPCHDDTDEGVKRTRDTLMSLILAGHETTAAQLAWAFQLLAHNPAEMNQLVAELDEDGDRYRTAVIQEVLRHRPVFLFAIPRAVQRPIDIAGTTYSPPAHLVGCIHLAHHDPDHYPHPHAFRPERFLDGPPRREIWIPWGGGRKRCPGHHLALLEMHTVLQAVLSRFTLTPARRRLETARWRSVIVVPQGGCRVVLRERAHRHRTRQALAGSAVRPFIN